MNRLSVAAASATTQDNRRGWRPVTTPAPAIHTTVVSIPAATRPGTEPLPSATAAPASRVASINDPANPRPGATAAGSATATPTTPVEGVIVTEAGVRSSGIARSPQRRCDAQPRSD